jgi:hypothetical protein
MHLQHAGTYVFAGKLPALASIGASATADADLLNKFKPGALPKPPTPQIAAPSVPKAVPVSSIAASPELLKKFKPI